MGTFIDGVRVDAPETASTLYVDPVAGSDSNDGGVSSPLATVQEAVYRFIPAQAPSPYWARGADKLVSVVHTPGMPAIQEYLHIPIHRGEGVLRIVGEEHIQHAGLIQSGSLSADGYYGDGYFTSHHQLTVTTSVMTPGTLGDGYFVRPTSNPNDHTIEFGLEMSPIVNNTADSLDVVLGDPGASTALGYADTMEFDVVTPLITWSPPDDQGGATNSGGNLITIDGGMVEISGFRFEAVGDARTVIHGNMAPPSDGTGFENMISRCIFTGSGSDDWFNIGSGSGICLFGCLRDGPNSSNKFLFIGSQGCSVYNLRQVNMVSTWRSEQCIGLTMQGVSVADGFGFELEGCITGEPFENIDCRGGSRLQFRECTMRAFRAGSVVGADGTGLTMRNNRLTSLTNLDVINAASRGIQLSDYTVIGNTGPLEISGSGDTGLLVTEGSRIRTFAGIIAGIGNSDYGIEVIQNSTIGTDLPPGSITGALGDALCGTTSHTWGDGPLSNLDDQSFIGTIAGGRVDTFIRDAAVKASAVLSDGYASTSSNVVLYEILKYDPSGGTFTLSLPNDVSLTVEKGDLAGIKNISTSATSITVDAPNSTLEDPGSLGTLSASISVGAAGVGYIWQYDGTNWLLIHGV